MKLSKLGDGHIRAQYTILSPATYVRLARQKSGHHVLVPVEHWRNRESLRDLQTPGKDLLRGLRWRAERELKREHSGVYVMLCNAGPQIISCGTCRGHASHIGGDNQQMHRMSHQGNSNGRGCHPLKPETRLFFKLALNVTMAGSPENPVLGADSASCLLDLECGDRLSDRKSRRREAPAV